MDKRTDARYWNMVGTTWNGQPRQALWRAHSDAVNGEWLTPRLVAQPGGRLLKTDLFDEALTTGLYPLLSARAQTVFGVDLSASTLRAAGGRCVGLYRAQADVRALPFTNGVFDHIVSNSTLDHFASTADIVAALVELRRVLRSGGQLLLTLDNLANPVVALRNALPLRLLNGLGIVPYGIGATCGPRRLQSFVRQAGFEVLEVGAILHCPRVLAVAAARMLEWRQSTPLRQRFLRCLMAFERLAGWRTRFLTGYFIAIVARKG
jgi:SAM-dependent methyltransferase